MAHTEKSGKQDHGEASGSPTGVAISGSPSGVSLSGSPTDVETFSDRRSWFLQAYTPRILELLDQNPSINAHPEPGVPDVRTWIWNAQLLFASGLDEAGNDILKRAELHPCEFAPMLLTQILIKATGRLEAEVEDKIRNYLQEMLPRAASERIHPAMYNDNFSNMATYVLLVAGSLLNLPDYVSLGRSRLHELCDQLRRCGSVMEYGSPTYSPVNMLVLAETVEAAPDEETRRLALRCEERLWVEMATHYHAETGRLAGPYSRAYYIDAIGHTHLCSVLFWAVFGDQAFINPRTDLMPPDGRQVLHYGLDVLMLPNMGWLLLTTYHLPDHLTGIALHKQYPFSTSFMTECIPSDGLAYQQEDEPLCFYGGHRSRTETFMTAEYAMGTAQHQYHEGAIADTFHITCRNRTPATCLADTNVLYSRFLFNERIPGGKNKYAHYGLSDASSFRDEGRKICLQHRQTALVLYKPKYLERQQVRCARFALLVPLHHRDELSVWLGDRPVPPEGAVSEVPVPVFLSVHHACFAFLPTALTDFGRVHAIRVERQHQHLQISFYLYEGPDRAFDIQELANAQCGFVCMTGTLSEYGSMEAFMAHAGQAVISDRLELSAKMWTRRVRVQTPETELYMVYNPLTETVITATANKKPVGTEIFRSDMLDPSMIPFLGDGE